MMTNLLEQLDDAPPDWADDQQTIEHQPEEKILEEKKSEPKKSKDCECEKCGEREFWIPKGSNDARCRFCNPPPARSLIKYEWFFDDDWNLWGVVPDPAGERCKKIPLSKNPFSQ